MYAAAMEARASQKPKEDVKHFKYRPPSEIRLRQDVLESSSSVELGKDRYSGILWYVDRQRTARMDVAGGRVTYSSEYSLQAEFHGDGVRSVTGGNWVLKIGYWLGKD